MVDRIGIKNTKAEQNIRTDVLEMCWSYLQMNFHKFSETNKIMIATKLCSKEIQGPLVDQSHHHTVQYINYGEIIGDNKNPVGRLQTA